MLEQLKYKNHLNEVFEFGKDGIFVNTSDLHDYSWTVTKKNNRISSLDRAVETRKLPVVIICKSEEKGIAARNKLLEIAEKDVLALQHGKVIIGDYYFRCFITQSVKKNYLTSKRMVEITLTLTSDFPYWVKESTFVFSKPTNTGAGGYLDYRFDHPFDYYSTTNNKTMTSTGFVGANFRMIIYGECRNPAVYIGGYKYQVNCDVAKNEYLTIDSVAKTVILTRNDGTQVNVFKYRCDDSYIFEKIPAGKQSVTWEGDFGFDVTVLEERSEPLWT